MNCTNFLTKCQNKVAENLVISGICVASKQASITSKHKKESLQTLLACAGSACRDF